LIRGPGEHALELEVADGADERVDLRFGIGDRAVVLLLGGELEVVARVRELLLDALDQLDLRFDSRALAEDDLSMALVVPKPGGQGLLVQLLQLLLQLGEVKDASVAPGSAAGGRSACLELRRAWGYLFDSGASVEPANRPAKSMEPITATLEGL
jgi:hypothetical protein